MPRFQLETSILLCACALASLVDLLTYDRSREGKLRLPVHTTGELELEASDDPFNVTKPEDVMDGYPIREGEFWANASFSLSFLNKSVYHVSTHRCD